MRIVFVFKKILLIFLMVFFVNSVFKFNVNGRVLAYDYENWEDYDDDDESSSKTKVKKGFTFVMGFDANFEKNKSASFVDLVVRRIKNLAIKKFDDENYVKKLFENYKVKFYDGSCLVKFYVYPNKGDLNEVKRFCRRNILDRYYSGLFGTKYDKYDYEEYVSAYIKRLSKSFGIFRKKVKNFYDKSDFAEMYYKFGVFVDDYVKTNSVLSSFSQDGKIVNKVKRIRKIIKKLHDSNFKVKKSKREDFDDYDDYFDDDYRYSKYFDDDDFDEEFDEKPLRMLYKKIKQLYKSIAYDVEKLKKINHSEFEKALNSVNFKNSIRNVQKKITKVSGYLEKVKER